VEAKSKERSSTVRVRVRVRLRRIAFSLPSSNDRENAFGAGWPVPFVHVVVKEQHWAGGGRRHCRVRLARVAPPRPVPVKPAAALVAANDSSSS